MNIHLNNKRQLCEIGPVQGWIPVGGKGGRERGCTLYACMKKED
jgi:hypothetical protein